MTGVEDFEHDYVQNEETSDVDVAWHSWSDNFQQPQTTLQHDYPAISTDSKLLSQHPWNVQNSPTSGYQTAISTPGHGVGGEGTIRTDSIYFSDPFFEQKGTQPNHSS